MRRFSALFCVAGLATAPASAAASPSSDPGSTGKGRLGAMVIGLTPELRKHFGAPDDRGVLVAHVDPGTPAATAGVEVGDVIVEVRGRKIDTAPDMLSALADLGRGEHARIELLRDGKSRSLDATLAGSASATARLSPPWLRGWMNLIDLHDASASPFDESAWSGDSPKPLAQTQHDPEPAVAPGWLRTLRKLFALQGDAPAGQGS